MPPPCEGRRNFFVFAMAMAIVLDLDALTHPDAAPGFFDALNLKVLRVPPFHSTSREEGSYSSRAVAPEFRQGVGRFRLSVGWLVESESPAGGRLPLLPQLPVPFALGFGHAAEVDFFRPPVEGLGVGLHRSS